jgi:hypothetical protein
MSQRTNTAIDELVLDYRATPDVGQNPEQLIEKMKIAWFSAEFAYHLVAHHADPKTYRTVLVRHDRHSNVRNILVRSDSLPFVTHECWNNLHLRRVMYTDEQAHKLSKGVKEIIRINFAILANRQPRPYRNVVLFPAFPLKRERVYLLHRRWSRDITAATGLSYEQVIRRMCEGQSPMCAYSAKVSILAFGHELGLHRTPIPGQLMLLAAEETEPIS